MLSGTQKLKYPSSVIKLFTKIEKSRIKQAMCNFIRKRCIVLHKTSHSNVSVINRSPYCWVHIEFHRTWTPRNYIQAFVGFVHFLPLINLSSTWRERMLSHGNVYKSYCCIGILISSLCPNVVLYGLYVWNSNLTICSSKVRLQYSRYKSSQIFRMTKPNDCKNLTFDAVSFFLLNVFNRCRLSGQKYVFSLFHLVQNKHLTLSLSYHFIDVVYTI